MSELKEPQPVERENLVIDSEFLKQQSLEALATFFAPLAGMIAAAKGDHFDPARRRRRVRRRAA